MKLLSTLLILIGLATFSGLVRSQIWEVSNVNLMLGSDQGEDQGVFNLLPATNINFINTYRLGFNLQRKNDFPPSTSYSLELFFSTSFNGAPANLQPYADFVSVFLAGDYSQSALVQSGPNGHSVSIYLAANSRVITQPLSTTFQGFIVIPQFKVNLDYWKSNYRTVQATITARKFSNANFIVIEEGPFTGPGYSSLVVPAFPRPRSIAGSSSCSLLQNQLTLECSATFTALGGHFSSPDKYILALFLPQLTQTYEASLTALRFGDNQLVATQPTNANSAVVCSEVGLNGATARCLKYDSAALPRNSNNQVILSFSVEFTAPFTGTLNPSHFTTKLYYTPADMNNPTMIVSTANLAQTTPTALFIGPPLITSLFKIEASPQDYLKPSIMIKTPLPPGSVTVFLGFFNTHSLSLTPPLYLLNQCSGLPASIIWERVSPVLMKFTRPAESVANEVVLTCPILWTVSSDPVPAKIMAFVTSQSASEITTHHISTLSATTPGQPQIYYPTTVYIDEPNAGDNKISLNIVIPDFCSWQKSDKFRIRPPPGVWTNILPGLNYFGPSSMSCLSSKKEFYECTLATSHPCSLTNDQSTVPSVRLLINQVDPLPTEGGRPYLTYEYFTSPKGDATVQREFKVWMPPDICPVTQNPDSIDRSGLLHPANRLWFAKTTVSASPANVQRSFKIFPAASCRAAPTSFSLQNLFSFTDSIFLPISNPSFTMFDHETNPNLIGNDLDASSISLNPGDAPDGYIQQEETTAATKSVIYSTSSNPAHKRSGNQFWYTVQPQTTANWFCTHPDSTISSNPPTNLRSCLVSLSPGSLRGSTLYNARSYSHMYVTFVRATAWIGNQHTSQFSTIPSTPLDLKDWLTAKQTGRLDHIIFDFGFAPGLIEPGYIDDRDNVKIVVNLKNGPEIKKPTVNPSLTTILNSVTGTSSTLTNSICMWELMRIDPTAPNTPPVLLEHLLAESPDTYTPTFTLSGESTSTVFDYNTAIDPIIGVYKLPKWSGDILLVPDPTATSLQIQRLVCFILPSSDFNLTPDSETSFSLRFDGGPSFGASFTQPFQLKPNTVGNEGTTNFMTQASTSGLQRPPPKAQVISSVLVTPEFTRSNLKFKFEIGFGQRKLWAGDRVILELKNIPKWYSPPPTHAIDCIDTSAPSLTTQLDVEYEIEGNTKRFTAVFTMEEVFSDISALVCDFPLQFISTFSPASDPDPAGVIGPHTSISTVVVHPFGSFFNFDLAEESTPFLSSNPCQQLGWGQSGPSIAPAQDAVCPIGDLKFTFAEKTAPLKIPFPPLPQPSVPMWVSQRVNTRLEWSVPAMLRFSLFQVELWQISQSGQSSHLLSLTPASALTLVPGSLLDESFLPRFPTIDEYRNVYVQITLTEPLNSEVLPLVLRSRPFNVFSACHPLGRPLNNICVPISQCPTCSLTNTESCGSSPMKPCNCKAGWTGLTCQQSDQCSGAKSNCILANSIIEKVDQECKSQCSCIAQWKGERCQTCGLQCANDGIPFKTCLQCGCRAGYSGNNCQCRARNGTITLSATNAKIIASDGKLKLGTQPLVLGHNGLSDFSAVSTESDSLLLEVVSDVIADLRLPLSGLENGPIDLSIVPSVDKKKTVLSVTIYYQCPELNSFIESDTQLNNMWNDAVSAITTFPSIEKHFPGLAGQTDVDQSPPDDIDETLPTTEEQLPGKNAGFAPTFAFILLALTFFVIAIVVPF